MPTCLWFCWVSAKVTVSAALALGTILASLAAAIAAYESRETVRIISEVEHRRLVHQQNKISADMYQSYVDFIRMAPPLRPCLEALKGIDDTDLVTLINAPAKFQFREELPAHAALAQCLLKEEDRLLYGSPPGKKWERAQTTSARGTIVIWLNQLDSYFLAFKYNVGNPGILCRNMNSVFGPTLEDHPLKELLVRMNEAGLLEDEEYVKYFLENYGAGKQDCPPTDIKPQIPPGTVEQILRKYTNWLDAA